LRTSARWVWASGIEKLALRAKLPGAFAFDQAAVALQKAISANVAPHELLSLAFASSWFVNNTIPSSVFQRWLQPLAIDLWSELIATLSALDSASWLALGAEDRGAVLVAAQALVPSPHGAGGLSKVLALLVPDLVPLMPDAALSFALGTVERSDNLDAQTASVDHILPMLDWFARERLNAETELEAIARSYPSARLSSAQVLDRLLWFDSAGHRHFRPKGEPGWYRVRGGDREGIVLLGTVPTDQQDEPFDLAVDQADAPWKEEARSALDGLSRTS
jgi:hypothetical protein